MAEFITGLALGAAAVFFAGEYNRIKSLFIPENKRTIHSAESVQWQNLMSYDGSERGQANFEH